MAMAASFCIVGAGKVGTALARLLTEAGYEFVGAASRSIESARRACSFARCGEATTRAAELTPRSELVLLTVPDDAIRAVCDALTDEDAFRPGSVVAHCSGALPSTILEGARECGAHVGSLHPMQSFATPEGAVRTLPGSCCCVEGDTEAAAVLEAAARAIGAEVLTIATDRKALYHAAGCVASGYMVALQNAALKLNAAAGIGRQDALKIMLPLLRGTLENIERVGIPACLTGPIARGDVETVRRHVEAIGAGAPELLPLYRVMGREAVEVALAKGTLTDERAERLRALLG
jgi:predicted short-subunit dehydrogenase-like oxidoreductase (DUF2520 family)